MMSPIYFAYGVNLSRKGMGRRAPAARAIGRAWLEDWRFVIAGRGYASIAPRVGARVEGLLWSLTPDDEASLDGFEGIAEGLYRKEQLVVSASSGPVQAWAYVAPEGSAGVPDPIYLASIVEAARDLAFPETYLRELRSWGPRRC